MKSDDFGQVYDFRRISDVFNLSNRECVIRWLDQYGGVAGYFICVYVFLHGSSAEEGTAEELLRQDGIYAQMVRLQTQSQGWTIV